MTEELDSKTYPIGKAQNLEFTKDVLYRSIMMIEAAPVSLRKRLETIAPQDLELTYREGSWTVRQIVHHLADSHMNMWIRLKHTLAFNNPTIQPYDQNAWADSADYKTASLESSLSIFEGIQIRFSNLLKTMSEEDFKRTYLHPEYKKQYTLGEVVQLYAWHSMHHVAQIEGIFK
ncbi:MAG: putative metal-dependent hydrolase [Bacteroidota bacterium]